MDQRRSEPASSGGFRSLVTSALQFRELTRVGLGLILLLFVALPFAHVLRLGPLWPTIAGFVLVVIVSRLPIGPRVAWATIFVCFAVFLTIQLLVIQNHWVEPVSDFKRQWEYAVDWAHNGLGVPTSPQTQRAIPFYYPLILLFGDSPNVYLTANVVLTSLTFLMAVWVARRYFGWPAAAKTSILLLCMYEPYFANTFPSHDILGSFGVLLFLVLLVEIDALIKAGRVFDRAAGRIGRVRTGIVIVLALVMSLAITWVDWQRTMGIFCMLALLFYGISALVQRAPRARLKIAIAVVVCLLSVLQSRMLKSHDLAANQPATELTSTEMSLLVFGSDEGDGRFADWYRNARMATVLKDDQVSSLAKLQIIESLRTGTGKKYENFLDRQTNFLRTGQDSGWYLAISNPRWLSAPQLRKVYNWCEKWTPPVYWAIALLLLVAAIFRRDVLFDPRMTPLILIGSFMAIMGLLNETQARYAMFLVFLWPIYAGSPFVADPLPGFKRFDHVDPDALKLRVKRLVISAAVLIAIPLLMLRVGSQMSGSALVNFDEAIVAIDDSPWATRPGAAPQVSVRRGIVTVSDDEAGSEGTMVTVDGTARAKQSDNTLRFVVYNEIGEAIEPPEHPVSDHPQSIVQRALRVFVDGSLVKTVDLALPFAPRAYEVPGVAQGDHEVKLELDLGVRHELAKVAPKSKDGKPTEPEPPKCEHRWKSPSSCINTSIAYLGFY